MPGTHDEFLRARSAKTRSNVQRYARRLEGRFGDGIDLRVLSPEELPQLVADSRAVHREDVPARPTRPRRRRDRRGPPEARSRARLVAGLRPLPRRAAAGLLARKSLPQHLLHGRDRLRSRSTGPHWGPTCFRRWLITCAPTGRARIDFGLGDAEYKSHFGDQSWDWRRTWPSSSRVRRAVAINLGSGLRGTR